MKTYEKLGAFAAGAVLGFVIGKEVFKSGSLYKADLNKAEQDLLMRQALGYQLDAAELGTQSYLTYN